MDPLSAGVNLAVGIGKLWSADKDREATEALNREKLALQREQDARQQSNFEESVRIRVKDAQLAGVHPLAALGASINSPAASGVPAMDAPSYGSAFADGLANLGTAATSLATSEKDKLNNDLIRSQIRNTDANTAATLAAATSRTATQTAMNQTRGGPDKAEFDKAQIFGAGKRIDKYPKSSDAQDAEDRYGEPGEWLWGIANMFQDLMHNYLQPRDAKNFPVPKDFKMPRGYHARRRSEKQDEFMAGFYRQHRGNLAK